MAKTLEQWGIDGAVLRLPNGREVVADYSGEDGYVLYTHTEWRTYDHADYEADADGRITFQGQATGWTLADVARVAGGCTSCGAPLWSDGVEHESACAESEASEH